MPHSPVSITAKVSLITSSELRLITLAATATAAASAFIMQMAMSALTTGLLPLLYQNYYYSF